MHFPAGQEINFQANDLIGAELILEGYTAMMEWNTNSAILHLKFSNRTTMSFGLKNEKDHIHQIKETRLTLERLGAICNDEMHNLDCRDAGTWDRIVYKRMLEVGRMSGHYGVDKFYTSAHELMAKRIVKVVQAIQPQPLKITLFSFGCGTGDELHQAVKQLKSAQLPVEHAFGFDIAQANFEGSPKSNTVTLKQGNIHSLEKCLEGIRYNQDSYKVGMFMGVLTDKVVSGTKQALSIIQQTRELDFIYIDGFNFCLLNKIILKSAGFFVDEFQVDDPNMKPTKESEHVRLYNRRYELRWMTRDERRYYLEKISTERSSERKFDMLDLSLSANPLNDLKLFSMDSLKHLKSVDISWSYLKDNEIQEFFAIINDIKAPNLRILLSKQQFGYEKIHTYISKFENISMIERLDSLNADEIPHIPPRRAKEIGLYKQLPNERITRGPRK